ncbi:hypothetical protein E4U42_004249 [Claviceps africana]|uniref:alpha-1,2-Mannosidase n=1 Tax=Claviceps africana TaxID=83212 RepID=A0A8K0NKY6_9HYPO|nr:hypothetical protein E4U42_004249 [Claviceps africana]
MPTKTAFAVAALLLSPALASSAATWRKGQPTPDLPKAAQVKQAFQIAWNGYHQHAFPNDTLSPISGKGLNDRNAWGATAVDALSTAIVIGEVETVNQLLDYIATIDFNTTKVVNDGISVFETNIRYLGGLLSGYDLLSGPYANLVTGDRAKHVKGLLQQALVLADGLSVAFDTPTGIPVSTVFFNPTRRASHEDDTNGPAGFGTLVLEWTRLSDLTGNKKYAELAQRAQKYLMEPTGVPQAFPGLVGLTVNITTGKFQDNVGSWGGGIDSYYEYLIKMYLYDPVEFAHYKDQWVIAADSSIKYLTSHPTSRTNLTFLAVYKDKTIVPASQHLAAFAGGNFILGGILLNEPKYVEFGLALAESYYETYTQTPSGIGPEVFRWVANRNDAAPPAQEADFYAKAGFWATYKSYVLRPEVLESLYYAYRVTGDTKWQDMAWTAYSSIRYRCRSGPGYAGLSDVMVQNGGEKDDAQESFFLAETLKYAYLIFADESAVQFQGQGKNGFVYNTEAHPVRVRA